MIFLGIDTSTTATKALLVDESGKVAGAVSTTYPYETPRPLWSEQDPALWWDAAIRSLRSVLRETGVAPQAVAGMGLTGQMHGLVLLDESGAWANDYQAIFFPTTFFVDPSGVICHITLGDSTPEDLRAKIEQLLAGSL